jgi:hypothetical protein
MKKSAIVLGFALVSQALFAQDHVSGSSGIKTQVPITPSKSVVELADKVSSFDDPKALTNFYRNNEARISAARAELEKILSQGYGMKLSNYIQALDAGAPLPAVDPAAAETLALLSTITSAQGIVSEDFELSKTSGRYAAASLKLDPTNTRAITQRVKQNRVALKMASTFKGKALLAVDSDQKAKFSLLNQRVSLELDTYLKSISPEARNSSFGKSLASELAEFRLKKY